MLLGRQVRNTRKRCNLSTESLAKQCDVSRSYITLIENGKRMPSAKVLPKLANALNIKTSTILGWYLEDVKQKVQKDLNN